MGLGAAYGAGGASRRGGVRGGAATANSSCGEAAPGMPGVHRGQRWGPSCGFGAAPQSGIPRAAHCQGTEPGMVRGRGGDAALGMLWGTATVRGKGGTAGDAMGQR